MKKKFYVKGDLGYSFPKSLANDDEYGHKKPTTALLMGLGVGYEINNYLNLDGTFYHFSNYKFNHNVNGYQRMQNIKTNVVLLNLNMDLYHFRTFSPFITAGGGISRNVAGDFITTVSTKVYGKVTEHFAWNIGVGIKGKLSNEVST